MSDATQEPEAISRLRAHAIQAMSDAQSGVKDSNDYAGYSEFLSSAVAAYDTLRADLAAVTRERDEKEAYAFRMDALAEERNIEIQRLRGVVEAAREMLKFGAHDGECEWEWGEDDEDHGPCRLHLNAAKTREDALRGALDALRAGEVKNG